MESGAIRQETKASKRLIEVGKSQEGWKRAQILPDMEVSLFNRMCCYGCFPRRWYPWELIRANVDTGWVIHVDQCSETMAPSIHLPRTTRRRQSMEERRGFDAWLHARLSACSSVSGLSWQFWIQIHIIHWHSIYSFTFAVPHARLKIAVVLNESVWITLIKKCKFTFLYVFCLSISNEVFLCLTIQVVCEHLNALYSSSSDIQKICLLNSSFTVNVITWLHFAVDLLWCFKAYWSTKRCAGHF